MFDRTIPKHARSEVIAFIQAINMTYGVSIGDKTWAGIQFDGHHQDKIIPFIMMKGCR